MLGKIKALLGSVVGGVGAAVAAILGRRAKGGGKRKGSAGKRARQAAGPARAPAAAPSRTPAPTPVTPPAAPPVPPAAVADRAADVAAPPSGTTPVGAGGDDLTAIKGLGKVKVARLAEAGVTSYAQIAAWTDEDIAAFGLRTNTSPGQIKREDWVGQARDLSQG
jgi:predicted flap endonuclease-1-like 5' DNA nuclease